MTAIWAKNETDAAKRRCLLTIVSDDGYPCSPGLDFIALGAVFVVGNNAPNADLATGTLTNVRRPMAATTFTFTAANASEIFTHTAHGLQTGDGPVTVSNSGGALPAGLVAATNYYAIKIDADTFYLATSLANAYAGTNLSITTDGTGTQTLTITTSTYRGVWGHFEYIATQAETNNDATEQAVIVDYTGYLRMNGGGAETTVSKASAATDLWEIVIEAGYTASDLLRGIARQNLASRVISGTTETTRDLADAKDSHHGTVTGSARTATIDDLT